MFPLHAPLDKTLREELAEYDDLTASLLARRGATTKELAQQFLNPSYVEHVHDPLLMTDMPKAAKRFADAIVSGEKIAVWSDYDCDGIPGAVLMHDFLEKAGANFENYIPHRHEEGYGVNVDGIEALAKNGVTLIVTVDSGITDLLPIARARELGIDVIVTDHHLPKETLPEAFAVVNPNAREEETYPFRGLCGSGVAWKLVCATLISAPALREKVPEGWEKWLLDMVGLATIADMVPLTDENRVLATYGLLVMRKSSRIGLQKLCRGMRTNQRTISEDDVGFMIAPRINAASRMGDAREAFHLFTTKDESEADALAKKLEKANRGRKAEAGAITRAVHTRLKEREETRSVIALGDPEWRPALLGLVANTIAEEYECPVFLWGREGNNSLKGSVRSGGETHILELMGATSGVFVDFGGHSAAGGFTVEDTQVFFLEDRLVEAQDKLLSQKETADSFLLRADAEITPEEISNNFLLKLERLAPFGRENDKPVFRLREVVVDTVSRFGKSNEHLKLRLRSNEGARTIDGVTFFAKGKLARVADTLTKGSSVTALAHLERDTFSRGAPVRLRILDLKIS